MNSMLTLPGTIPGLLRRGSPVLYPKADDIPCVVVSMDKNSAVIGYPWPLNHEISDIWQLHELNLDLTDATGRAHAIWWLDYKCDRFGAWAGATNWHLRTELDGIKRWGPWSQEPNGYFCPALQDLDSDDPRLLPDGSRLVDAKAIQKVVIKMAGLRYA